MIVEDDEIRLEHINEVLDLIVEECCEVGVARSKHRRFGADSCHPDNPGGLDNWQALKTELLDVYALTRRLIRRGIITHGEAENHCERKIPRVLALHPHLRSVL